MASACMWRVLRASGRPDLYVSKTHHEELFAREGLWPPFVKESAISRARSRVLDEHFGDLQFMIVTCQRDEVLALGHAIPLHVDATAILPDRGWEWALETGAQQHEAGIRPNTLCALSVTAYPGNIGKGMGAALISAMITEAKCRGYRRLIVPTRPVLKKEFPNVAMANYVKWRRPDGTHFDPWIRVHERLGARILTVCERSMEVTASIVEWQRWTGLGFNSDGAHVIPGALSPIIVDPSTGMATYVEANVWMEHYIRDTGTPVENQP